MSNEREMRFVTRQETFNDLAVRELAKGRSACICRIQFGRCSKAECASCQIHAQYERCYNQMSDYDRQRLASYVAEQWQEDSLSPSQWLGASDYVKYNLKVFFGILISGIIMLALSAFFIGEAAADPYERPSAILCSSPFRRHGEDIIRCIEENNRTIRDYNKDGRVNCVDYACGFKRLWDKYYPESACYCIIVRNMNPANNMHHLFIKVGMIEVETRCENPNYYTMMENWGRSWYDPRCNIYGETGLWMRECNFW